MQCPCWFPRVPVRLNSRELVPPQVRGAPIPGLPSTPLPQELLSLPPPCWPHALNMALSSVRFTLCQPLGAPGGVQGGQAGDRPRENKDMHFVLHAPASRVTSQKPDGSHGINEPRAWWAKRSTQLRRGSGPKRPWCPPPWTHVSLPPSLGCCLWPRSPRLQNRDHNRTGPSGLL